MKQKLINMKKLILLLIAVSFVALSCKKSSSGFTNSPGDLYNEVKATVSMSGGASSTIVSTGNTTVFAKRVDPNGDTVITILGGSSDKGNVQIMLVNTSAAGTYAFESNANSRQNAACGYLIGNPLTGPIEYYSTQSTNPAGTINIESLTPRSIKGSFMANCAGAGGIVQITNGSFKGNF